MLAVPELVFILRFAMINRMAYGRQLHVAVIIVVFHFSPVSWYRFFTEASGNTYKRR